MEKQFFSQIFWTKIQIFPFFCSKKLISSPFSESEKSDDMYFCFRWVLVWFKREFSFLDTCKLWEVLWSGQPCPRFLLLICVAILDSQTNIIIDNQFGLTEILKVGVFGGNIGIWRKTNFFKSEI